MIHAAVGEKAHLGIKRHFLVKKSSLILLNQNFLNFVLIVLVKGFMVDMKTILSLTNTAWMPQINIIWLRMIYWDKNP